MRSTKPTASGTRGLHDLSRCWRRCAVLALLLFASASVLAAASVSGTFTGPAIYTPGTPQPGAASPNYQLVISNAGPDADASVGVSTSFPAGTTVAWSCTASGAGSVCPAASGSGNLANAQVAVGDDGSVTYAFRVGFASSMFAHPLVIEASLDPSDVTADIDLSTSAARVLRADMQVSKTSGNGWYAPNGSNSFVVTVTNAGPSDARDVDIVDSPPVGMSFTSWECTPGCGSGSSNISHANVDFAAGASRTYTIQAAFDAGASAAQLTNTASVLVPATAGDPVAGNNSASATLTRDPRAGFTLSFTSAGGVTHFVPGEGADLTLHIASGGGFSGSVDTRVTLDLPDGVTLAQPWTCAGCVPASGNGDVSVLVPMTPDTTVDIPLALRFNRGLFEPQLDMLAILDVIGSAGDDPTVADTDPANRTATYAYTIQRRAEISIELIGPATLEPGAALTYELRVTNAGPSDVGIHAQDDTRISVLDDLPASLRGQIARCPTDNGAVPCWRYCPSDGGVPGNYRPGACPATHPQQEGYGDLLAPDAPALQLSAGSTSIIEIYARAPSGGGPVQVDNTASAGFAPIDTQIGVTDSNAADDSDSISTTVQPSTDLQIAKSDNGQIAVAGNSFVYAIGVTNAGFNDALGARITDLMPLYSAATPGVPGFVPGSIRYTCMAGPGACCTHGGSGAACSVGTPGSEVWTDAIDTLVDLGRQSSLTLLVTGTIDGASTGTLQNTADVATPAGLADANPANNSATATSPLSTQSGLSVQKRLAQISSEPEPPYTLTYEIIVYNAGPSRADDARVADLLNHANLDATAATWSCSVLTQPSGGTRCDQASSTGPGALSTTADLDVGGRVRYLVTVPTTPTADGVVTNIATVEHGGVTVSSNSVDTNLSARGDIGVRKTGPAVAIPGTTIEYDITMTNTGLDNGFGVGLQDVLPDQLENATWSCAATTPVPGDLEWDDVYGDTATIDPARFERTLATSDDGRHVYLASASDQSISVYSRDATPGASFGVLAPLETERQGVNDPQDTGAVVDGLHAPIDMVLSADGARLYVLSAGLPATTNPVAAAVPASIAVFARVTNASDPAFGRLNYVGRLNTDLPSTQVRRLAVLAGMAYVSGNGNASAPVIAMFRLSAVSGMPTHDGMVDAGIADPSAMVIDATHARLALASDSAAAVALFDVLPAQGPAPAGRLGNRAIVSDAALLGPTDLAIDPALQQLFFVAGGSGRTGVINYNAAGSDPVGVLQSFNAGPNGPGNPGGLSLPGATPLSGPGVRIALSPDGEHLLISNAGSPGNAPISSALLQLRRVSPASGALAAEDAFVDLDLDSGAATRDLLTSSDGRHVLLAPAGSGTPPLVVYSRRAPDPRFSFLEVERFDDGQIGLQAPADLVTSADGEHVYAVSLAEGALTAFRRDGRSGVSGESAGTHLTHLATYVDGGGISGLARATRVQISPDGRTVLVSSEDNNTLAVFERNRTPGSSDFGKLSFRHLLRDGVGGVDGLLGAQGIAFDPNSNHVYVAGSFEAAIASFRRSAAGDLEYLGVVKAGTAGVIGMNGMRDLVVSGDGRFVMGVSTLSNAVVVLRRDADAVSANFGRLAFLQARTTTGVRLMSIAIPATGLDPDDDEHVYVVGQDDNSVIVLKREGAASSAEGTLSTLFEYRGVSGVSGPRDILVSADGRRVFVGSQFGNSVQLFERDRNRSSANFGGLTLVESRGDGEGGIDGLANLYAIAGSFDARNVYVAGFGDRAIASFAIGAGSRCSQAGSGDISDLVDIAAGGTLQYRITATVRADATGQLCNRATVQFPDRFEDTDASNDSSEACTALQPQGDLSVSKTNERVSVVAGETVRYEVRIANAGPSDLRHTAANPLTVTDLLDPAQFDVSSAQWTCSASNSGALDLVGAVFDRDPADAQQPDNWLGGAADVALVPARGLLPSFLAVASVLDDSLTLLERDSADGSLTPRAAAYQNGANPGGVVTTLAGARAVAASADGRFVYVASRVSDAVTVFRIDDPAGDGVPQLVRVQAQQGIVGLDQASHLVLSPDSAQAFVYVAGGNDDAIAVFRRDPATGELAFEQSLQNGIGGVSGLDGVEFLALSPDTDGAHLYAIAGGSGSVARFDRNSISGHLTWRNVATQDALGVPMQGASGAVFDAEGEHLYIAATGANTVSVLQRVANPAAGNYGDLAGASSVTEGQNGNLGLITPRRLTLSRDGAHLYVTGESAGSIAWYARDRLDGSLRHLGQRSLDGSGIDGLGGALGVVIDDELGQVYVAGSSQSAIVHFRRQDDSGCPPSGSGSLDQIEVRIAAGGSVTFLIDVNVANDVSGSVSNTASVHSGYPDPDPDDNSASDEDSLSILADLSIHKDDGLAEFDGFAGAQAIAATASDVYVAGRDDNAIGHAVRDSDVASPGFGALRFVDVTRSGVDGVLGLNAVADLALAPDHAHLYAVSPTDNSVAAFTRGSGGALAFTELQRNGVLGVTGMSGARALALSSDGRSVYVVSEFSNAVVAFSRNADAGSADHGRLGFQAAYQQGVGGVDGMLQPAAVAVSPDGEHVYVLSASAATLAVFRRNANPGSGASLGQLSYVRRYAGNIGGGSGLEGGRSLAFDTSGAHLYVLGGSPGTLARYARNAGTGELVLGEVLTEGVAGVAGLAGAQRLRLAPDAAQLYVAGGSQDTIAYYTVGSDGVLAFGARIANGDPAPNGGQVDGLAGASDVAISADGEHLYAVSNGDDALVGFDRHPVAPDAGALAYRETLFDGLGGIAPGESVRYEIVVANAGPAAVPVARVRDIFPPQFVSASWACIDASAGAQCSASGSGNLDTVVSLPPGSSVTFEAIGVLGDGIGGTLVNTATVTGEQAADPDISNNSSTDGNTVLSPALDLQATFTGVAGDGVPGGAIDYTVEIFNQGPTYAAAASVVDRPPAGLVEVEWTCAATPVAGVLDPIQSAADTGAATQVRITRLVSSAAGQFVYGTGTADGVDAVLVWRRNPLDGTLDHLQTLRAGSGGVSGIAGARDMVLSADERFAYVAGQDADAITLFARDAQTGLLTYVTRYADGEGSFDGLGGVLRLALGPGGSFLYAAGALDDAIAVLAVNASNGQLAFSSIVRQTQPGMDGLNGVVDLAFDATGTHLIALARDNRSIAAFQRHASTGALTRVALMQEFEQGSGGLLDPVALSAHEGRYFVASGSNGRVSEFAFDAAAATFSLRPASIEGLSAPVALSFEPDQARLYVAESGASQVQAFSLLGAAPQPLQTVPAPDIAALAPSSDRRQLYGGGSVVRVWARARGSRCGELGGGGAIGLQTVDIAPGGRVTYQVSAQIIPNATGALTYEVEAQPRTLAAELDPSDNIARDQRMLQPEPSLGASKSDGLSTVVAGTPLVYTLGFDNGGPSAAIGARVLDAAPLFPAQAAGLLAGSGAWTCEVAPALAPRELRDAATEPELDGVGRMTATADGRRVYAVSATRDALLVFTRQPDGSLGPAQEIRDGSPLGSATVEGLDGASAVRVSADGRSVLVTGAAANSLVVFSYDPDSGAHAFVQKLTSGVNGVLGMLAPEDVVLANAERSVFVASPGSDAIAVFSRNPATGTLSFVERVRDGLGTILPDSDVIVGVRRLQPSADGRHLYALAWGSQTVSSFAIDAATSRLTYLGVLRRAAVPGLSGARDLAIAPGSQQLYALGNNAIVQLARQPDGRLAAIGSLAGAPGLEQARAITLDRAGARAYVVDAGGGISIFARDWSGGALAFRHRIAAVAPVPTGAAAVLADAAREELLVSVSAPGTLRRYAETPLSHCPQASGSGDGIDQTLDLAVGGSASMTFGATVHPGARGVLRNVVRIEPAAGSSPGALPGEAEDLTTIMAVSDLSVSKSGPLRDVAGTSIAYQIEVGNAGPSDALGLRVIDTLPAALRNVQWTCTASGSSSCPASGTTTLDLGATLKVGDTLQIALLADIDPAFLGTLVNRVDVTPEVGATDPTPGDLSASVSTEVVAEVDLSVSKSDGVERIAAGASTTYTILVGNAGPSDAAQVRIVDPLPAGVTGLEWTCSGSGGASCAPGGVGAIDMLASVPVGAQLTLQAVARTSDIARGQIINIVAVSVQGAATETAAANNQARDINALDVSSDLQLTLTDAYDPFDPGGGAALPFEIDVYNAGPSSADQIALQVDFSHVIGFTVPAGCLLEAGTLLCEIATLRAGAHQRYPLGLFSLPAAPSRLDVTGLVGGIDTDPDDSNNSASQSTELRTGADVAVTLMRTTPAVAGEAMRYEIVVRNQGSIAASNVEIDIAPAAGLIGAAWTCQPSGGASCPASGAGVVLHTLTLGPGQSLRYVLSAIVDPALPTLVPFFIEQQAEARVPGGIDFNPDNNFAEDRVQVSQGIFRDGFEDTP